MSNLEEYMKNHRAEFDTDQPREGHFERFGQRIRQPPVRRINFRHALQIAASVAIILASGWVIIKQSKSGDKVAQSEIPAEMLETEEYYATQVSSRYDQIQDFIFENSGEKAKLLDELKNLDEFQQQLVRDLELNPDNDQVISAMIRHYQMKLDVMDQIINQLNQFKSQTTHNHEKESV